MKAYLAKRIITLRGEESATGAALFRPLASIDNGIILVRNGKIDEIGSRRKILLPAGCPIADLGDATIIPAPINAHCHLQLSHLAGKTSWGRGFAAWLESLVPLLLAEKKSPSENMESACLAACREARRGAAVVGDFASPPQIALVEKCSGQAGLAPYFFCENFGFADIAAPILPENPLPHSSPCAPAGHALYSTAPKSLRLARDHCRRHKLVFAMHLAESREEIAQLLDNSGPLAEFYHKCGVLPKNWQPPKMRPLAFAKALGLLGPGFLAVHGVWLEKDEMRELAQSQSALCLCPRSNANLAVGCADLPALIENGVLLALGTDGLVSNNDVNVINEALFLRGQLPDEALIRMLTVNGAKALNLRRGFLAKGQPAEFRIWPHQIPISPQAADGRPPGDAPKRQGPAGIDAV